MGTELQIKVLPLDPCEVDMTWYGLIRDELLRGTVGRAQKVLDIGCGDGEVLLMLSGQIGHGMGVDMQEDRVEAAEEARKSAGAANVEFKQANALDLPFRPGEFDVVLVLGDVLGHSNLYRRQREVLAEVTRVLKPGGLTIYDATNWDWEWRLWPSWTFFTRTGDERFDLHRVKRTPSGIEIVRDYEVLPDTPLQDWLVELDWPVNPRGNYIIINVIEERHIPRRWLRSLGVQRCQNYAPDRLRRLYKAAGFRDIDVIGYGETYDIVSKAGLLESIGPANSQLAKAEAELALRLRTGYGPWNFLIAYKPVR